MDVRLKGATTSNTVRGRARHTPTTFVRDLASRFPCSKCAKAKRRPAATLLKLTQRPRQAALETCVQALLDHHEPGGHQRTVPHRQSIRRQPRADAGRVSGKALMDATKKRAEKLQAKGKEVEFKELLRMEPDGGTTNIRNVKSKHWRDGWVRSTAAWCRSPRSASSTRPKAATSGSRSKKPGRSFASPASGPLDVGPEGQGGLDHQ